MTQSDLKRYSGRQVCAINIKRSMMTLINHSSTSVELPSKLLSALQKKRLIFTVTTGRSGTRYLSFLLSRLPGTESRHEPSPNFATVMRSIQKCPEEAFAFWCNQKLPAIAESDAPIYAETSHLFCKGFFEPLLELGVRPSLIFLRRYHREVALSLFRLQTIPGRSEKALHYYLSPEDPTTCAPTAWTSFHDYQLCYWYALEIERRSRLYRKMASEHGLRMGVLRFSSLIKNEINGLTDALGMPSLPHIERYKAFTMSYIRQTKTKNKKRRKKENLVLDNINELEAEVEFFFARSVTSNYKIEE